MGWPVFLELFYFRYVEWKYNTDVDNPARL